jgi:hypothetical protein
MKTIGILTLPLHNNFGGILQSYALQSFLTKKGHKVILIDRQYDDNPFLNLKYAIKRLSDKTKFKSKKQKELINANPTQFIHTYMQPKTARITSEKQLKQVIGVTDFDAVIVGSDQVWRLEYSDSIKYNLFLDFIKNPKTKKMSYAASFGVDNWKHPVDVTTKVKTLLKSFDEISVREDSGVMICENVFDVDAIQHVDPTMLLQKEDYIALVEKENEPKSPGDILVYMLDVTGDRQEVISAIEKELNGKAFMANKKTSNLNHDLKDAIYPTITSWLKGFMDAKYVVVDSFHGCVFSILFNKPFVAYGNKARGLTRFTSMLKLFGLEGRLILDKKELTKDLIHAPIDWYVVNAKLAALRSVSEKYLNNVNKDKKTR